MQWTYRSNINPANNAKTIELGMDSKQNGNRKKQLHQYMTDGIGRYFAQAALKLTVCSASFPKDMHTNNMRVGI